MIEIYTDGACSGNPGSGGWGLVAAKDNMIIVQKSGTEDNTTNNRMELQAILVALELLQKDIDNSNNINWVPTFDLSDDIVIYSDSAYCVNAYNIWMHSWANNRWTNSKGNKVENVDLMKALYYYYNLNFSPFQVEKIKGHSGIWQNELADALATNNQKKVDMIYKKQGLRNSFDIL